MGDPLPLEGVDDGLTCGVGHGRVFYLTRRRVPGRERLRHHHAAEDIDPAAVLVLDCGTFVFGISGGLAGVRARLDPFGGLLAAVAGPGRRDHAPRGSCSCPGLALSRRRRRCGIHHLDRGPERCACSARSTSSTPPGWACSASPARAYRAGLPGRHARGHRPGRGYRGIGGPRDLIVREVPHVLRTRALRHPRDHRRHHRRRRATGPGRAASLPRLIDGMLRRAMMRYDLSLPPAHP